MASKRRLGSRYAGPRGSTSTHARRAFAREPKASLEWGKMDPERLEQLVLALDGSEVSDDKRLAVALALTETFPAERVLWQIVLHAARRLGLWERMAMAAAHAVQLTAANERHDLTEHLVFALHKTGRDKEAVAVLRAALGTDATCPDWLSTVLPELGADPRALELFGRVLEAIYGKNGEDGLDDPSNDDARGVRSDDARRESFEERCFALAAEVLPENPLSWVGVGWVARRPEDRLSALENVREIGRRKLALGQLDDHPSRIGSRIPKARGEC